MPIESIRIVIACVFRTPAINDVYRSILVADSTEYAERLLTWSFAVIQENNLYNVANFCRGHGFISSVVINKSRQFLSRFALLVVLCRSNHFGLNRAAAGCVVAESQPSRVLWFWPEHLLDLPATAAIAPCVLVPCASNVKLLVVMDNALHR
jgi:hypothetical protein